MSMGLIVTIVDGYVGTTFKLTSTDAKQTIDASILTVGGNNIVKALISVETNPIRYGSNITPVVDGAGSLGHKATTNSVIELKSFDECKDFSFLSATAGNAADLMITPFYGEE